MRTALRRAAAGLLLAGLAILPAGPALAAGTTTTPLPVDAARTLVLDEARGHLFVAAGSEVLVTDLAGAVVRRLAFAGADGMLLAGGTLYVAAHDDGAVAAVDAATLTASSRWDLPGDLCPQELAMTAGRLVFTATNCGDDVWAAYVGTLDPATGAVTVVQHSGRAELVIATNAAADGLVAVADTYASPATVVGYDVRGAEPVAVRGSTQARDVDDLAMAPDGRSVFVSGNDGGFTVPMDTLDLGRREMDSSVAVWSGDGSRMVVGKGEVLGVWPAGATATSVGGRAAYGVSATHGLLAVDRTAARAWVVSGTTLVGYDLAPDGTRWTLSASRTVQAEFTPGTLRADLSVDGQPVEDGVRVIVLVDRPGGWGTTEEHYTSGGGITLSLFPERGLTRYYFSHYDSGDGAAFAYADVIGTHGAVLSQVWGPEPPVYAGAELTWYARLTDTSDRAIAGARIDLRRDGVTVDHALTDGDGYVMLRDVAGAAGTYAYTLRFAGDGYAAAVELPTTVVVEKQESFVWVEATLGKGKDSRTATVVGHLGAFDTNRSLTITATPDGGAPVVIARGDVDDNLTLTVRYPMKKATTFTVRYAGDDRYAPAEASVRLTSR